MDHPDLTRVQSNIGEVVVQFCRDHLNKTFNAEELRKHVTTQVPDSAPASADRILRNLRQKGLLNYVLVSRSESLYLVTGVA